MLLLAHLTLHDAIALGIPYALLFLTVGALVGTLLARRAGGRTSKDPSVQASAVGVDDSTQGPGA